MILRKIDDSNNFAFVLKVDARGETEQRKNFVKTTQHKEKVSVQWGLSSLSRSLYSPWFRCIIIFFLTITTQFSMCNSQIKMVTPTKSKHYNKAGQPGRHQMVKTPQKPAGGSRHRTTPSPSNTSMDLSFKTPQNPSKSRVEHLQQQRCKSEPKAIMTGRGRSVTPPSLSSSPGPHFAMAKGIEPPTPTSLPRPPTNWTRSEQKRSPARQALSFDDLVMKPKPCIPETIEDSVLDMSQQLRLLLKVAA